MIITTRGIVLRSVKYGDTSLISTIFTRSHGVQSYLVQGVRSARSRTNRAALLQPASLLDLVVYQKPQAQLHRIREMQFARIYMNMQEDVYRNSIALFSAEILLRLLPEQAPHPELFEEAVQYFSRLDTGTEKAIANFPLYFLIACGRHLGYEIQGTCTAGTPHLDLHEGRYTEHPPAAPPFVEPEAGKMLSMLLEVSDMADIESIHMQGDTRFLLIESCLAFLRMHTQHMGVVKSLPVLRAVLR